MPLARLLIGATLASSLIGCTAPIGDRVLRLVDQPAAIDQREAVARTLEGVAALLAEFRLPEERKRALEGLRQFDHHRGRLDPHLAQ